MDKIGNTMANTTLSPEQTLLNKIQKKDFTVAVIGLGYVGLPLVEHLGHAGVKVIGVDLDKNKIEKLKKGESYIQDVKTSSYQAIKHLVTPTMDYSLVGQADIVNICVPTPLVKTKDPDVSYIISVCQELKKCLRPGQLIILESTTYPGTTDELVMPILGESGLTAGKDYFLAFSPERVDPGNKKYNIKNTPKVVGGLTPTCTKIATEFYKTFIDHPVPVSSTRVAEMVKILENTFRWVNIGLVNEISVVCNLLGIDTWETIDAAATKPFGFLPFYPGPGLGGHCSVRCLIAE
jgi:UDP-N-acetyl-D-glucosamine dehydrogenase